MHRRTVTTPVVGVLMGSTNEVVPLGSTGGQVLRPGISSRLLETQQLGFELSWMLCLGPTHHTKRPVAWPASCCSHLWVKMHIQVCQLCKSAKLSLDSICISPAVIQLQTKVA